MKYYTALAFLYVDGVQITDSLPVGYAEGSLYICGDIYEDGVKEIKPGRFLLNKSTATVLIRSETIKEIK